MAFPDHLLTLATLRLLTLTPLASSSSSSSTSTTATASGGHSEASISNNNRFHSVRSHPLHVLSELTAAYLHLLGNAAKTYAEQAGRTTANAVDAREAIEQYGGSIEEVDEWARECQLDRGILSSNDIELNTAAGARTDVDASDGGNDLGALLKDTARNVAYHPPVQVLEYAPLTDREAAIVDAVQHNNSLLPFLPYELQQQVKLEGGGEESLSSSAAAAEDDEENIVAPSPSSSSSRAVSPPPPSYNEAITTSNHALSLRKREKQRAYDDNNEEEEEDDDPLSFLPPFPDLDATQASLQTIIEDESGRIVKRARRALDTYLNMGNGSSGGISTSRKNASLPWLRAVPYEASSLAEYEGGKFSVPSIKKESRLRRKALLGVTGNEARGNGVEDEDDEEQDEEEDAFIASSLPYFLETYNWVSLDYEQQGDQALLPLRHNIKRKRAATAIHSNILNPSDDSLSGSIPAFTPRHAKKQAGWIPYPPINPDIQDPSEPGGKAIKPFPMQLHPFSTQLPASITEPVPQLVLPHASKVLAPPMHPRYPTAHTSIRTLLESSSPALFGRTTRMGPPGPLLENGAAGFYQVEPEKPTIPGWPGDAMPRMMGWNFDWEIGNELEDGIKERKLAGIEDVAVHQSSTTTIGDGKDDSELSRSMPVPQASNISNTNAVPTSNGIHEYTGPSFPSLPTRPVYDPQQALQREQERKNEEAELTFQEVQEDQANDERIQALEREARLAQEAEEEERLRILQQQQQQQQLEAEEEYARKVAAEQREEARLRKEAEEEKARKEQVDKTKIIPKLSFSLKLGSGSSSSNASSAAPAPPAADSTLIASGDGASDLAIQADSSAISQASLPACATESTSMITATSGLDAGTMDFEEIGGEATLGAMDPSSSAIDVQSTAAVPEGSTSQSGLAQDSQNTTMWTPGTAIEQDYRAPAADITSLSQPPIAIPGASDSIASVAPSAESSVLEEAAAEVAAIAPTQNAAEDDAEGEGEDVDAENESAEDDLFDEVDVVDQNDDGRSGAVMEGDAVYAASPAYQDVAAEQGDMHVEVEEMGM